MFPILNIKQGKTEHYYENLTFPVTFTGSEIDIKFSKEITPMALTSKPLSTSMPS